MRMSRCFHFHLTIPCKRHRTIYGLFSLAIFHNSRFVYKKHVYKKHEAEIRKKLRNIQKIQAGWVSNNTLEILCLQDDIFDQTCKKHPLQNLNIFFLYHSCLILVDIVDWKSLTFKKCLKAGFHSPISGVRATFAIGILRTHGEYQITL